MLSDIPGGLGGPTQYSILNTLPLDPNPRNLGINITVGLGQMCCQIYQGAKVGPLPGSPLNTQYITLALGFELPKTQEVQ